MSFDLLIKQVDLLIKQVLYVCLGSRLFSNFQIEEMLSYACSGSAERAVASELTYQLTHSCSCFCLRVDRLAISVLLSRHLQVVSLLLCQCVRRIDRLLRIGFNPIGCNISIGLGWRRHSHNSHASCICHCAQTSRGVDRGIV